MKTTRGDAGDALGYDVKTPSGRNRQRLIQNGDSLTSDLYERSTNTGQWANRTTRSATEPINNRLKPVRP